MGQLARWVDRTREGEQTLYDKYMRIIIIISSVSNHFLMYNQHLTNTHFL